MSKLLVRTITYSRIQQGTELQAMFILVQIQNYNTKSYAESKRIPLCAIFSLVQSHKEKPSGKH
jgi:hypothetical protein